MLRLLQVNFSVRLGSCSRLQWNNEFVSSGCLVEAFHCRFLMFVSAIDCLKDFHQVSGFHRVPSFPNTRSWCKWKCSFEWRQRWLLNWMLQMKTSFQRNPLELSPDLFRSIHLERKESKVWIRAGKRKIREKWCWRLAIHWFLHVHAKIDWNTLNLIVFWIYCWHLSDSFVKLRGIIEYKTNDYQSE